MWTITREFQAHTSTFSTSKVTDATLPSLHSFQVRLPIPVCLNNFLKVSFHTSACMVALSNSPNRDGMLSVEMNPEPLSRPRKTNPKSKRKSTSVKKEPTQEGEETSLDDAATLRADRSFSDDGNTGDASTQLSIEGIFSANSRVVISWAAEDAAATSTGDLEGSSSSPARFSLKGQSLETNLAVQVSKADDADIEEDPVEMDLKWECELIEPFYPGLESHAFLQ